MSTIMSVAKAFFEACETGGGWDACEQFCTPDASFAAQSDALSNVTTLQGYTDWMKGLLTFIPDGSYEVKSFATDEERQNVTIYGIFTGTHTGEGGPCAPTGKRTTTDYVYSMSFSGDRISHMTKIWNDAWAVRELGWA